MSLHKTYSFDEAALRTLIGYDAASPTNLVWLQDHGDSKKGDAAGIVVDGEPSTVTAYWPGCVDKDGAPYSKKVSLQIKRVVYWLLYPQEDQNDKPVFQVYAHTKVDPLAVGMYFQGEQPMFSLRLKNRDSTLPKEYLEQYAAREAAQTEQLTELDRYNTYGVVKGEIFHHAVALYKKSLESHLEKSKLTLQDSNDIKDVVIDKSPTDTGDCSPTENLVESSDTGGVDTKGVPTPSNSINDWVATWDSRPVEENPLYAAGGPVAVQPHIKVEANLKGECVLINLQHNVAKVFPDPIAAIYSIGFLSRSYSGDWCIIPLLDPSC